MNIIFYKRNCLISFLILSFSLTHFFEQNHLFAMEQSESQVILSEEFVAIDMSADERSEDERSEDERIEEMPLLEGRLPMRLTQDLGLPRYCSGASHAYFPFLMGGASLIGLTFSLLGSQSAILIGLWTVLGSFSGISGGILCIYYGQDEENREQRTVLIGENWINRPVVHESNPEVEDSESGSESDSDSDSESDSESSFALG